MPTYQIVGNLLIFAALGFLVPVRFAMLASLPRVLAVAAAGSVLIETAQYLLPLDRVASIDDVLLNTVGAGLAALGSRRWWRARSVQPAQSGGDNLLTRPAAADPGHCRYQPTAADALPRLRAIAGVGSAHRHVIGRRTTADLRL